MMPIDDLRAMLDKAFPDGGVHLTSPDDHHFQCMIVSDRFDGHSMVERHQMVYAAVGDAMREAVHALSLKTYTPAQWDKLSANA